jgi:glycosyltransferase involved in cell wall biosynthesis
MTRETGLSVPPGDPRLLADAVTELLADEGRRCRFGLAARNLAEQRYSWGEIGKQLVEVYEEVLGRVPAAA